MNHAFEHPMDDDHLAEMYTALHEGLGPNEFIHEQWRHPIVDYKLGLAVEIQYKKKIPDMVPSYHHPWADQAQPTIAVTTDKQCVIYAGKYETTRRGIEDRVLPGMPTVEYLKQPYVQRETLPGVPKGLITLGTLEWIRYKFKTPSGWQQAELVFPPEIAPEIAHDQKGNLHILNGQYQINGRGVEKAMYSTLAHDNPYHRGHPASRKRSRSTKRRSRDSRGRFLNPVPNPAATVSRRSHVMPAGESGTERAQRMILNSIIVGGVATLTAVAFNMGLDKFAPTWSGGAKAATKILGGLGLGLGAAYLMPTMPSIAAGISVGGVIDGFLDLWSMYVAPRLTSMTTTTTTQTTQQTTQQTPPATAQQVLLPGGIPQSYQGYSPAACGVPMYRQ